MTLTGGISILNWDRDFIKHIWPFLGFFVPLALYLCPFDSYTQPFFGVKKNGFAQRWQLLKELGAVACSPFTNPLFHRCFIADVLCSMPKVFQDLQYTFRIYLTDSWAETEESRYEWKTSTHIHAYPTCGDGSRVYTIVLFIFGLLPFNIRLMQCLRAYFSSYHERHMWNAFKYLLTLILTIVSKARNWYDPYTNDILGQIWVGVGITATIYSLYWDIFMDWGLGERDSPHFLLRKDITFEPRTYYTAIILNGFMRLGWALVISPYQPYVQQHFILLLGAVEITRRFLWSIIRIEKEHIHLQQQARESSMQRAHAARSSESG